MAICTSFCTALQALPQRDVTLPSRDELLAQLPVVDDEGDGGWFLGTWQDIQHKTSCGFCELVLLAIRDSFPNDIVEIEPGERISVFLFPDEHSFRLSYPSLLGTRIAFATNDEAAAIAPDNSRASLAATIDLTRIKSWLAMCNKKHDACGQSAVDELETMVADEKRLHREERARLFNESATSNFRVIDVESSCIRSVALSVRYVTLSYVWGQLPMYKLQKDNLQELTQEGSFEGVMEHLPTTVQDAFMFVRSIGERYLWIDGLCLVQDDPDDVALGIGMMNSIYRGSYFTIVAGSGANAGAGLPGLRTSTGHEVRRTPITKQVAPGLHMSIAHSIDWHLSRSIYNERGWTLQKLVLPRRTLIFINGQIYFRCQEANWSEDTWSDKFTYWLDADDSNISRIPDVTEGFLPSLWAYQKLCEEFSRRSLRDDGDSLRALAGVTRPMAAGMDTIMLEGLPGYYLDHFLLFTATKSDLRRRDRFASFSWAGWEGNIMFPRESYLSYKQDSNGGMKALRDTPHIFKYLRHGRIVQWSCIDVKGSLENLSFPWYVGSTLIKFLNRFPSVFDAVTRDLDELHKSHHDHRARYSSGSSSSGSIPMWDRDTGSDECAKTSTVEMEKLGPLRKFNIRAFDLTHSVKEFEKLVSRLDNRLGILTLQNWLAVRRSRTLRAEKSRTAVGARPEWSSKESHLCDFRTPRRSHISQRQDGGACVDQRLEYCRQYLEDNRLSANETAKDPFDVPVFPPYTVLFFTTVSLHLRLDATRSSEPVNQSRTRQNPFDRTPGIALLSKDSTVAGSLHPDNIAHLPASDSIIELLVIAYSQTPTIGSALLIAENENLFQSGPWELLWCLYIVWEDGIAERRGVAQIQQAALETVIEPKPCVKTVLLG
ncbi:HET-domain-containing protein [Plenodomus tracheiphilus IPT5]|uniref:HET-domain-containing protein n=1 Tax=Plenodomus tracheiphilus IPT5 TaxID=1408161 RepID=A0A6A7BHF2_9PLEO|nr:HET-domain-containing protein [Plenodomus tracheiphilus IPT5]